MSIHETDLKQEGTVKVLPSPEFLRRRKAFMVMPLVVIPCLFLVFISLGGGQGAPDQQLAAHVGLNPELPGARFDKKKPEKSKLEVYKQADQDSLRRKEYLRRDPYYQKKMDTVREQPLLTEEARADDILERLSKLRQNIRQPEEVTKSSPHLPAATMFQKYASLPPEKDSVEPDPELEKLNGMLDKIIRIQHPTEAGKTEVAASNNVDTMSNGLPAVIREDHVLAAGATIALRMTAAARINGILFPKDQQAYGVVSISNDRMVVTVTSLRLGQSIYTTALQVYDLDGLPGIHIPGDMGRDVAKESADQGIRSLGTTAFDPSLAGQAVNAGVLTARSLLSRKVRQVRVRVKAGYQVLLKSTKAPIRVLPTMGIPEKEDSVLTAPDPANFVPYLHRSVRGGKMELTLQGIYLRDGLLWLALRLENHGPIDYLPDHIRWCVQEKRQARRTAIQEITLEPVYSSPVKTLAGDSSRMILTAFRPFALPGDKKLVLQMAESNGARGLYMEIRNKDLLKLKVYGQP